MLTLLSVRNGFWSNHLQSSLSTLTDIHSSGLNISINNIRHLLKIAPVDLLHLVELGLVGDLQAVDVLHVLLQDLPPHLQLESLTLDNLVV